MAASASDPVGQPMIAVVIPYYQQERGILAKALRSVQAQRGAMNVKVFVVDDASPVPAADEVAALVPAGRFPIEIIRRVNGGPGAARNSGLDSLPPGTRYVAFLDSDDEWNPSHLGNACAALESGFDVFFADLMQLNAMVSGFARMRRLDLAAHPAIADAPHLHAYVGDMFTQIVSGNVIGTSTVVYRVERFPQVRFRPEFRTAGEDYLFWMDLAVAGARFAFSDEIEAVYGRGVNVYSGVEWGSVDLLWRIHYEMRYRDFTLGHYRLSESQRALVTQRRHALRDEFAKACLHRMVRLQPIPLRLLRQQMASEPGTVVDVLRAGLRRPVKVSR